MEPKREFDDELPNGEPAQGGKKRLSVERIYQKLTQLEHVLKRPDTYIGTTEHQEHVSFKIHISWNVEPVFTFLREKKKKKEKILRRKTEDLSTGDVDVTQERKSFRGVTRSVLGQKTGMFVRL